MLLSIPIYSVNFIFAHILFTVEDTVWQCKAETVPMHNSCTTGPLPGCGAKLFLRLLWGGSGNWSRLEMEEKKQSSNWGERGTA